MGELKTYYPADWQDDQTMDVLFSPFREKEINPQAWDQKMKFWTELILKECAFTNSALVDTDTLPMKFGRKGKIPVCLNTVMGEMHR